MSKFYSGVLLASFVKRDLWRAAAFLCRTPFRTARSIIEYVSGRSFLVTASSPDSTVDLNFFNCDFNRVLFALLRACLLRDSRRRFFVDNELALPMITSQDVGFNLKSYDFNLQYEKLVNVSSLQRNVKDRLGRTLEVTKLDCHQLKDRSILGLTSL